MLFVHYRILFVILFLIVGKSLAADTPTTKPNVLFIAVDDLNHWVGYLGRNPQTRTPNIDRLAARGVAFANAQCAAPVCNPSRAALMSGLRPSTTGVYDNGQAWQPVIGKDKTLTTQFLAAGYNVFGTGKIYHGSAHRDGEWTEYFNPRSGGLRRHPSAKNDGVGGIKFAPLESDDQAMPDYKAVDYAIEKLNAQHDKPFFLAVGLVKPHMPWNVPKKYFDMFPLDKIELPPHSKDDLADVPPAGKRMANPDGDHARMLASGRWKEAVQAYLATIAFSDAMIGRLIDALDKSPHRDNTIVVLWGDHGWHLGEKEHWRKFALWEESTRTPLVWVAPGVTKFGGVCQRPVDLMTIYPTLCDLCGIATPTHVEGPSIRKLLADPQATWDQPALTTFHQNNHSLRDQRWRYIRYANGDEELYDHVADPYGWTNLAADTKFDAVKARLAKSIPKLNRNELPRAANRARESGENPRRRAASGNANRAQP
ncbi:MAG: sulfatase [Pirellulales bacterium]